MNEYWLIFTGMVGFFTLLIVAAWPDGTNKGCLMGYAPLAVSEEAQNKARMPLQYICQRQWSYNP